MLRFEKESIFVPGHFFCLFVLFNRVQPHNRRRTAVGIVVVVVIVVVAVVIVVVVAVNVIAITIVDIVVVLLLLLLMSLCCPCYIFITFANDVPVKSSTWFQEPLLYEPLKCATPEQAGLSHV